MTSESWCQRMCKHLSCKCMNMHISPPLARPGSPLPPSWTAKKMTSLIPKDHCLIQGSPTPRPQPTTGPWPNWNWLAQAAGWRQADACSSTWVPGRLVCMHTQAQLNLRKLSCKCMHVHASPLLLHARQPSARTAQFPSPPELGRQATKVGDRWSNCYNARGMLYQTDLRFNDKSFQLSNSSE